MSRKSVLITGSNGYIGKIMQNIFREDGYEIIGLDTNYYDKENELYAGSLPDKIINKDIRNVVKSDLEGIEVICHLAALSNDPIGELNPNLTFDINHEGSVKLAKLAKEVGVSKFIFSSSCSVYGISDTNEDVTEEGRVNPITAYAKSKVSVENELSKMGDDKFSVAFMRNATAYGNSPKLRIDIVVNNLCGWAHTQNTINIMSDGTPWRPLVHIEDISRAFLAVANSDNEYINGHIFNVGGIGENYQIKDLAEIIKKIKPDCEVSIGNLSPDSRSYKVSFKKIKKFFPDLQFKWNVEKGVVELLNAYEKYGLTKETFSGRNYIRLKQINYLLASEKVTNELFWV